MKKIVTLFFAIALLLIMSSMSFMENPDGKLGYTNSPGEGNCAASGCHNSFSANTGAGSVSISAPAMTNWQYVPGQSYTINVTVAYTGRNLFGLGFEALRSTGANGGTLTAGSGTYTGNISVSGNSRTNITHSQNGGASANSKTFSFTWVAPAASVGTVTFYCSGLCADGNGGRTNDYVYTTSQAVTPLQAPTAPTIIQPSSTTACTGTTIPLSVTAENGVTYAWFNASNTQVGTGATFNASATGCYHVTATNAGGSTTSTNEICVTISSPNAAFNTVPSSLCANGAEVALTPTQAGGTFTGPGVSGTTFNPGTANVGANTITYSITDGAGCTSTSNQTIQISAAVNGTFEALPTDVCADASAITLVPAQTGGTFTGSGVSGTSFNPANAGVGLHSVTYSIANGACSASTSQNITVNELPNASFTGLQPTYCLNSNDATLSPINGSGTFSGPGMMGDMFSPSSAGLGVHTINYTVVSSSGCSSQTSLNTEVVDVASSAFSGLNSTYCTADAPAALVPTQAGGTFSGVGVEADSFNPLAAGSGQHTITYTVDFGGCSSSTELTTSVFTSPDATFSGLSSSHCVGDAAEMLVPVLAGGNFVGADGDMFNSNTEGTFEVTYSVISADGCTTTSSQTTTVHALPNASFTGLNATYCLNDNSTELTPATIGGTFTGADGGMFNPLTAGVGQHVVSYDVTSEFGCSASSSATTLVNALPVASIQLSNGSLVAPANLDTYSWANCTSGAVVVGETNHVYTPTATGSYAVTVSQNGCAATSECVEVSVSFVDEHNLVAKVYPNPASELLNVSASQAGVMSLYTITGELAGTWNVATGNRVLYVGDLTRGSYLIHWTSGNYESTKTLILE